MLTKSSKYFAYNFLSTCNFWSCQTVTDSTEVWKSIMLFFRSKLKIEDIKEANKALQVRSFGRGERIFFYCSLKNLSWAWADFSSTAALWKRLVWLPPAGGNHRFPVTSWGKRSSVAFDFSCLKYSYAFWHFWWCSIWYFTKHIWDRM